MNLYIKLNSSTYYTMHEENTLLPMETMSLAGKEIILYWLEWAKFKGYKKLFIDSIKVGIDDDEIQNLQNLYDIEVIYQKTSYKMDTTIEDAYTGIGIFLDNGEYRCFKNLNEALLLEQELIYNPLKYCSLSGYGKSGHIQIGKNVYIHKSVKLYGAVIIGDNCIVEKHVEIEDSVINNGCLIKKGSIVKNCHIDKNIHMNTNLYLKNKGLFESTLYDIIKNIVVPHEGICFKK